MQANGRFIKHIQHASQAGANLRRETNALAFAAGERRRVAFERKIAQADRIQKFQSLDDLPLQPDGDELFALAETEIRARYRERPSAAWR